MEKGSMKRLKFWGWGFEDDVVPQSEIEWMESTWGQRFGVSGFEVTPTPRAEDIRLPAPRLAIPAALTEICTTDHYERVLHSYSKSFPDIIRVYRRECPAPADVVALPRSDNEIAAVLDWCYEMNAAAIPFGGGSSVVGGVVPPSGGEYRGAVSIDMRHFNRVLEIDPVSHCARIQAGTFGPALEAQLKPSGLTLRHFPQSFRCSTLGGWIATRAGGHFATLYTHIDDLVENLRLVTPAGVIESRRLPGSGAGPSPDRMFIGSEGILGIITEAWMRVRPRPSFRATASVRFRDFYRGADAVRMLTQSNLYPTNCRLLDAEEAQYNGLADGTVSVLVVGFESADHPVGEWMKRALEICADHGGSYDPQDPSAEDESHRSGAAGRWRERFMFLPFFKEHMAARNIFRDSYETAITWDRFKDFHADIRAAGLEAIRKATGREGSVTCRFTHVYPDGPAPYLTFHGLSRSAARLLDDYWAVKSAASDAIIAGGGTITHHHAVGREHRPWYDRQRPELFARALGAAKRALDPKGLLNPGVLIDPIGPTASP
ncbi:MAG: FAD-binding oxidoreductase [Burkholderiales bacterium]|nr:FAD-binding oxidoreductase [Burkholderiales bacterium]